MGDSLGLFGDDGLALARKNGVNAFNMIREHGEASPPTMLVKATK